jgi:adenosylcobinamide-GDP ribazoletransferase
VAAALVVAADLASTGMLHVDGLADCGDGLLPPLSPDRRLAVMADPHVGAFGVVAVGATLLARYSALRTLRPSPALLAGLWCLSRTAMAAIVKTQPYARGEGGLASGFAAQGPERPGGAAKSGVTGPERPGGRAGLVAGIVAAGLLVASKRRRGAAALLAASAAAAGTVALARRRVGGYTGDVAGAAGFLAETAGLVAAAARW